MSVGRHFFRGILRAWYSLWRMRAYARGSWVPQRFASAFEWLKRPLHPAEPPAKVPDVTTCGELGPEGRFVVHRLAGTEAPRTRPETVPEDIWQRALEMDTDARRKLANGRALEPLGALSAQGAVVAARVERSRRSGTRGSRGESEEALVLVYPAHLQRELRRDDPRLVPSASRSASPMESL